MAIPGTPQIFGLCLWMAASGAGPTAPADEAATADPFLDAGERIYRLGILPDGEPMSATVQEDVPLTGTQAACVSCHRRSGLSAMEGQTLVPPVSGALLYQPHEIRRKELYQVRTEGPGTRPAYTDATLMRAIREGVDPAGRTLDPLMPRYALTDEQLKPLIAYLKNLSAAPSPGVDETSIHFATIVTDRVDETRREAMLSVLDAYVQARNAETRHEQRRAERSPFHKEWKYTAYRRWVLHVWRLSGANRTWRTQLEEQYDRDPVFAVIGGIGEQSWRPVHEFCDDYELPCLFPETSLPVIPADDSYSLYFSKGVTLDAEVLARHLRDRQHPDMKTPILQVFRVEDIGQVAAQAFRQALPKERRVDVTDRPIGVDEKLTPELWAKLAGEHRPSLLVLWLRDDDLRQIAAVTGLAASPEAIYLSSRLCADPVSYLPEDLRSRVFLVYPFSLPDTLARQSRQVDRWLRARGKPVSDERLQLNTLFTARLAGESLMHIRNNFYRDYFMERIEEIVDRLGTGSAYPHLALGPGQRVASTGGYIVGISPGPDSELTAIGEWIVP